MIILEKISNKTRSLILVFLCGALLQCSSNYEKYTGSAQKAGEETEEKGDRTAKVFDGINQPKDTRKATQPAGEESGQVQTERVKERPENYEETTTISTAVKNYNARREQKAAAATVQAAARGLIAREMFVKKKVLSEKKSAVKNYAATTLQATTKGVIARKIFARKKIAAATIQAAARGPIAREMFVKKKAAEVIKRELIARKKFVREKVLSEFQSALKDYNTRKRAATTIQASIRGLITPKIKVYTKEELQSFDENKRKIVEKVLRKACSISYIKRKNLKEKVRNNPIEKLNEENKTLSEKRIMLHKEGIPFLKDNKYPGSILERAENAAASLIRRASVAQKENKSSVSNINYEQVKDSKPPSGKKVTSSNQKENDLKERSVITPEERIKAIIRAQNFLENEKLKIKKLNAYLNKVKRLEKKNQEIQYDIYTHQECVKLVTLAHLVKNKGKVSKQRVIATKPAGNFKQSNTHLAQQSIPEEREIK